MVRDKVLAVVWLAANAAGAWSSRWIPVQGPDHGWALVVLVAITADPVMTRLVRGARRGLAPLWVAVGLSVPALFWTAMVFRAKGLGLLDSDAYAALALLGSALLVLLWYMRVVSVIPDQAEGPSRGSSGGASPA